MWGVETAFLHTICKTFLQLQDSITPKPCSIKIPVKTGLPVVHMIYLSRIAIFDLAYAWEVLHHLDNPLQAVAEMKRVSRRYLVLIEPNRNNIAQFLFALLSPEHRLVFQYSRRFLDELVNTLGLHIIYTDTILNKMEKAQIKG